MKESTKYPKKSLTKIVNESYSYAEVMRKLGKKWSGGQQQNLKRWISHYGLDTSHFTGQGHNKGKSASNKKHWSEWFVLDENMCMRQRTNVLRRAMIESGIKYVCSCGQGPEWKGKTITLQINHKNGNWKDNRKRNLEFICPNCHSATPGWSGRKNVHVAKLADATA